MVLVSLIQTEALSGGLVEQCLMADILPTDRGDLIAESVHRTVGLAQIVAVYRQNCTTIPPVSHHQQTFTYQSHYADNQRPVLQENPPNQQYSHQWWE